MPLVVPIPFMLAMVLPLEGLVLAAVIVVVVVVVVVVAVVPVVVMLWFPGGGTHNAFRAVRFTIRGCVPVVWIPFVVLVVLEALVLVNDELLG